MFEINTEQILILLILFLLYKLSKCSVIEGLPEEKMPWGENCHIDAKARSTPVNWYKKGQCPAYYECARKCMRGENPDEECSFEQNPPGTVKNRWWKYRDYTYFLDLGGYCSEGSKNIPPTNTEPGERSLGISEIPGEGNNA